MFILWFIGVLLIHALRLEWWLVFPLTFCFIADFLVLQVKNLVKKEKEK